MVEPEVSKDVKMDESKLHYEDGKCYYTDPETGVKLLWDEEKKEWAQTGVPDDSKDYVVKNGTYYYTDKVSGTEFKWDPVENKWKEDDDDESEDGDEKEVTRQDMSKGVYGLDGDKHTYTDPNDKTVYEWDPEKHAWFPKIDEDFLAQYQMSYGFTPPEPPPENKPAVEPLPPPPTETVDQTKESLKRKAPEPPTWFEVQDENNTKVYVSNLPTDITEQEFIDLMQKCGLVMKDLDTGKMKIKLYTEPGSDVLKGDALCTYIKVESVQLALNLLDGYDVRGKKIRVERAKFTMKGGAYDPNLKPKKKRRKDKDKMKKIQEKLFDWRPEKMRGERLKHEKVVVLKNVFEPSVFDREASLILEYQQDLREECTKCGDVNKIIIHDRHPDGVVQIRFKEAEAADACVQLLNGRWFGQRRITAETWDGKTKYKIYETDEQIEERIKKWDSFLENEEEGESAKKEVPSGEIQKKIDDNGNDSDGTRSSAGSGDETDEG